MTTGYAAPLAPMAATTTAPLATSQVAPSPYHQHHVQRQLQQQQLLQQQQRTDERSAEQAAFEYLTNVLNATWTMPLEIEILPPSLQRDEYVVRIIENCIGVPQKLLALAFVYARLLFFHGISQLVSQGLPQIEKLKLVMSATQLMLLHDPDHITAANARKRHLRNLLETCSGHSGSPSTHLLDDFIRKELWLLDSLQTSPLKKHTKSPTLWQHRRWLMDEFLEWVLDVQRIDVLGSRRMSILIPPTNARGGSPNSSPVSGVGFTGTLNDATDVLWHSFIAPELRIICRAGEQHPSNYYSWDFARELLDEMFEYAYVRNSDILASPGPNTRDEIDPSRVVASSIELVKTWCGNHVSDTSGWAFLLDLMGRAAESNDGGLVTRCFVEVGNLALTLRVRNEPVWNFMRVILASGMYLPAPFRASFVGELQGWLQQELEAKNRQEQERIAARNQDIQDGNQARRLSNGICPPREYQKATSSPSSPPPDPFEPPPAIRRPPKRGSRDGQFLSEVPYFDVVIRHFRWMKYNWQGEPRPAIFEPLPPLAENQQQLF